MVGEGRDVVVAKYKMCITERGEGGQIAWLQRMQCLHLSWWKGVRLHGCQGGDVVT